ncbi:hypothetical protein B0H16DRAFT_1464874 [Mycena metata]|uniref:Tetratricopeptide repeat protein n=1 Tax=Mycena metata TaxID=1033252 RepID=A0AAD7N0D3_9AGAR|nr:hypothetical protein B0H16DRAFT_1464874 [Mycena metata]
MTNAQKFGQQALKFSAGNIKCQSSTTRHLALIHHNLGDHIMAIVHARQSRKLAQLAGNPMLEARALHIEINCLQAIGNYALGISLCQTAHNLLELCMSDGLPSQAIMNSQAEILTSKSEYREARLIYTQLLAKSPLTLSPYHHILNLLNILFIDINTDVSGNTVLQEINILQGILNKLEQYKNWDKWFISMCAEFQLREGDFLPAETGFQRCLNLSWGSDGENVTFCLQALADGYRWGAKVRLTWATLLLVNSLKTKQKVSIHKGLQFMSHFFLCLGDQHTAHSLLTLALEGFTDMDIHQSKAECMLHLGEISEQRGDFSRALQLWEQAKPLFKRSSQTRQLALVDEKISQIQPHLQADQQKLVLLSELHPPSGLAQTQMIKM